MEQNLLEDIFEVFQEEANIYPYVNISPKTKKTLFANFAMNANPQTTNKIFVTRSKEVQPQPIRPVYNYNNQPTEEKTSTKQTLEENFQTIIEQTPVSFKGPKNGDLLLIVEKNSFQNTFDRIQNDKEILLNNIIEKALNLKKTDIGIIEMPNTMRCKETVINHIADFSPKVILIFGPDLLKIILNQSNPNAFIGKELHYQKIPTLVVYALNTLVRNASNEKRITWETIKKILIVLGTNNNV